MNDQQLMAIVNQGKQEDGYFYLNKQHHVALLTDSEVTHFYRLIQEQYPALRKFSLDDLNLSDRTAAIFGQLIKLNHLTHFSLQGSSLGDQCFQSICNAISFQAESVSWLMPTHSGMPSDDITLLESLIIGAPIATDYGLSLLEQLIISDQHLKKISVNWSPFFSISQAWKLASSIAIHNLSLVKSDYHGFFHNVNQHDAKAIDFINNFLEAVIKRNQHLATLKDSFQKYIHYFIFFSAYNVTIRKNFDVTKTEHGLTTLSLNDLLLKPLDESSFISKLDSPKLSGHRRLASWTLSTASTASTASTTPSTPSTPRITPVISPTIPNGSVSRYSRAFSDLTIDLAHKSLLLPDQNNEPVNKDSDNHLSNPTHPS